MQFGGHGATNGGNSEFCIMITHRATHRLPSSKSLRITTFLSSPKHLALSISLRVTFGCCWLWKWASTVTCPKRGGHHIECDTRVANVEDIISIAIHVSQTWRTWYRMRCPNSGRFPKQPSTGVFKKGLIAGASVCVCVCVCVCVRARARARECYYMHFLLPWVHSGNVLNIYHTLNRSIKIARFWIWNKDAFHCPV
jgi:hypothetical protein